MGDLADEPIPGEPSYVRHGSPWQRRLIREHLAEKRALAENRTRYPLYLRFGEPPEGGRSTTYRSEAVELGSASARLLPRDYEAGVSAFRARTTPDGFFECDTSAGILLATTFSVCETSGRPAFELFGREVGIGSDGEPLLAVERFEAVPLSRVRSSGHHRDRASFLLGGARLMCLLTSFGEAR